MVTGEDGYKALEIAIASMESTAKNAVIKLKSTQKRRF
jgi:hypothetical protein